MTTYRVATGTNIALGSLTVLSPQPRSEGIKPSRRSVSADGTLVDEARYVELEWDFSDDPTTYVALLTLFGVNVSLTAAVTVYVRDERYAWVRMNGTACRPEVGKDVTWQNYFPRRIVMLIKDISASA